MGKEMKNEKIDLKKAFIIAWIVLLAVLVISMVISIKPYKEYKKAQDLAVNAMLLADSSFKEYRDDRKVLLEKMYDYFNYTSTYGYYFRNVAEAKTEAENSLGDLLKEAGYDDFYFAREIFEYKNFFEYYYNEFAVMGCSGIAYLIAVSVVGLINLYYFINRKKEIEVKENKIIYKKFPKKTQEFMVKDVTSAETTGLKGLKVKGNEIKVRILLVKNNEELKDYIIKLLPKASGNNGSTADELEKYKKLLDSKAITKEEYDKKKKELLNL